MGLEAGQYIADLITTNPLTTDSKQQGDDHIRLIKTVLKNTFPGASKPFGFPNMVAKSTTYTVLPNEMNTTFLCDMTAGAWPITMPTLTVADAGWSCWVMKSDGGPNPLMVTPPSGLIISGQASIAWTRRCIPWIASKVFWTGSNWIAERAPRVPVGTCLEYQGGVLPVGYEWPNGQTLPPSSYPDFATVRGGGLTQDRRGRYAPMADQGAGRLGNAGIVGTINSGGQDGVGGEYYHVLTAAELAPHTHNGSTGYSNQDINHSHTFSAGFPIGQAIGGAGNPQCGMGGGTTSYPNIDLNAHTHNFGTDTGAGVYGGAHNILPPTIVCNFILVVE